VIRASVVRRAVFIASAVAVGIVGGDIWRLTRAHIGGTFSQIRNGPWYTSPDYGSEGASDAIRAEVARRGLFALRKEETVYYTAAADQDGQPLNAQCDYVVTGAPLAARWWSLTLYGEDDFLVDNPAHRYSYDAHSVDAAADGSYRIALSGQPQPAGDWLFSGGPAAAGFSLTLRLYNPAPSVYEHLATTPLPVITRKACR